MKKILQWVMVVLVVLMVPLYNMSQGHQLMSDFPADMLLSVCALLLIAVFVFYAFRYAGRCCPNCGCRIYGKYEKTKAFDGRFPCPKCGAMIEL